MRNEAVPNPDDQDTMQSDVLLTVGGKEVMYRVTLDERGLVTDVFCPLLGLPEPARRLTLGETGPYFAEQLRYRQDLIQCQLLMALNGEPREPDPSIDRLAGALRDWLHLRGGRYKLADSGPEILGFGARDLNTGMKLRHYAGFDDLPWNLYQVLESLTNPEGYGGSAAKAYGHPTRMWIDFMGRCAGGYGHDLLIRELPGLADEYYGRAIGYLSQLKRPENLAAMLKMVHERHDYQGCMTAVYNLYDYDKRSLIDDLINNLPAYERVSDTFTNDAIMTLTRVADKNEAVLDLASFLYQTGQKSYRDNAAYLAYYAGYRILADERTPGGISFERLLLRVIKPPRVPYYERYWLLRPVTFVVKGIALTYFLIRYRGRWW